MKKVILAFWNRWHVMQGLTKVGSGNLKTNPRFPGAQNQEKCAIWQTDPVKLHPNFGQPWEAAWVPVTDGLPFRSLIILERSDAWLWLGRRSPSMCPHATGTWIAACGFQGTASPKHGTNSTRQRPHWQMCVALSNSRGHLPVHLALDFDANIVGILCYHIVWGGEEVATPSHSY